MKKSFFLLLFLVGCMMPPEKSFQVDPDTEIYSMHVSEIETVPMTMHFDVLPHIENQMPISPEDAIISWVNTHLKATEGSQRMWVIIKQAEMIKTDLPNKNYFKLDEESYTLNYQIKVQIRNQENVIQELPVEGKGYITMAKKASLSSKEKGWAWLIQKMLTHLKTKMQTDLKDVFVE